MNKEAEKFFDDLNAPRNKTMSDTELYQCPYCPATTCQQTEPCNGCETWAEAKMIPCTRNEALKEELIDINRCLKNALEHIRHEDYNDALSSILEGIEAIKELDI